VKRLFNQPNLTIKTVPLNLSTKFNKDIFVNNKNGMSALSNNTKQSEISILPIRTDEEKEDFNFLPSKIEDKKSEIALVPVRKKICGHYEPCENIVCDVTVQQYVDENGVSPMLATNIEEEEIDAPVTKHCKNEHCDALSIDHNRCRRALIKLHKCDKSRICDICGTTLKGWRHVYRIYHKDCKPKDEYRHNNVDRIHLLRERMRERELQILEIARTKRNDYSDPTRALEILQKNKELIIIPKTRSSQQPIAITSVSTQSISSNLSNAQLIDANSRRNNFTNIGNVPVLSQSNTMSENAKRLEESKIQPMNQMRFSNLQQNSYVTCTVTCTTVTPTLAPASIVSSQNQYIHLATPTQITTAKSITTTISTTTTTTTTVTTTTTSTIQPLTINNWVMSSSCVLTTTPIQPKPFLAPIRVLPITNLITAPSLLHRTQGIPKFCIMTDNLLKQVTIPNPSSQQSAAVNASNNSAQQKVVIKVPIQYNPQKQQIPKKIPKKKNFVCIYCSKHFSTDWYFKMHVARHEEKPFSCHFCNKSFSNKFDMRKHVTTQHADEDFTCTKCNYVCKSSISLKNHIKAIRNHVKMHATSYSNEVNKLKKLKKEDETNCIMKTAYDLNGECTKIKSADSPSDICINDNKNKVCINGKTIDDDAGLLESVHMKKHHDEMLLTINGNNSEKPNGFNFVSVKEEPEDFKKEIVTSR